VRKAAWSLNLWHLETTTALNDYLTWPGLQQAIKLTRSVLYPKIGQRSCQIRYGITSPSPQQASPRTLLFLKRQHWEIENCLHWVRDVTLHENRTVLHSSHTPHLMATLRNVVLSLLRLAGDPHIASTLRLLAVQPALALALVVEPLLIRQ
jgi:hypothetical protein